MTGLPMAARALQSRGVKLRQEKVCRAPRAWKKTKNKKKKPALLKIRPVVGRHRPIASVVFVLLPPCRCTRPLAALTLRFRRILFINVGAGGLPRVNRAFENVSR